MDTLENNCNNALVDNSVNLHPEGFEGTYGCMFTFDEKEAKNHLRYKMKVKHTGRLEGYFNTYTLNRDKKTYINDSEPDSFIDKLAMEVSSVLYPLQIKTLQDGTFLSVVNFEEIKERWYKKKAEIQEKYKGAVVEKYIQLTSNSLYSQEVLNEKMAKDWFVNLYFSSLYKWYSDDCYVFEHIQYPIAGTTTAVNYNVTKKIGTEDMTQAVGLMIEIKGEIEEERCILDIEQGLDFSYNKLINPQEKELKGNVNITYLLNKQTGVIEGCEGVFSTEFTPPKKTTVQLFLLEKNEMSYGQDQEQGKENKKNFWSTLFKR
ncbi:hypothetical protein HN014_08880 [Aquimarina sp. TRL1]|uniref:hypothetical protein n=1 Tax=Aquimarina sp. (strain TRL1) TaxID=2736252 RepID=UPI00158CEC5C|nr:hypothetical protein [Aquimarina sp. TRL1]QKX05024.1 hypothetical protein HN014_08880 [Aquimarina sp. TRL1]